MADHKAYSAPGPYSDPGAHLSAYAPVYPPRLPLFGLDHCPLSYTLLSEHPVVQSEPECRATYLYLLDDWQRLTLGRPYAHKSPAPVSMKPRRH